ncbi:MAG TPA: cysteine desulfurase family protein, partial [Myxococcota bacterium]|nr:cysteine desulfurase family protein [Myxococcota bacterium]
MTSTRGSIYLDNHATTPLDERVFLAMKPYFFADFGNPASQTHPYGWKAQDAVDQARLKLAAAINAHPSEIIFTASATEATNLALKGLFFPQVTTTKRSVIISSIEHSATLTTAHALEALGLRLVIIKPSKEGVITPELLSAHITDDTALVSFFLVHNEIGTINDIKALCAVAKRHNALIHCDGAQALGRITIDCQELGIDFLSLSAHKVYGPKGVGALYVRREIMPLLCPVIHGGGQEWQKRSGTINVPGVVGFGEAAAIANSDLHKDSSNIQY